jgi:hypothetical protein
MTPKQIPGMLETIIAEHAAMRAKLLDAGEIEDNGSRCPIRWKNGELMIPPPPEPPVPAPLSQGDPVGIRVRGKHAAHDNVIPVKDEAGKTRYVNNLSTRIDSSTTSVVFMSTCEGTVCLRADDNKHSDFWMEFNLDVPMLERLLSEAKRSAEGEPQHPD